MPVRLIKQSEPIPGYRLIERLGRGGFGEVWKAEAPGGLLKAIKFVFGDLGGAAKDGRLAAEQELRALNRVKQVRHPFILSLERVDIIDGQLIIVMELADRNLSDRLRECESLGLPGIPREELLGYMEEAAEALDLMNTEYQLQHLDIKPQNLFLVHNHVKVADFGLVKDLEGMKATVTGGVTPLYAAPETFDGWVSRYCDQYSLAIVYQELLTGRRPFDGTNPGQLVVQHMQKPPDLESLPAGDREIVARALAKKPPDRYPSCGYFVRLLRGGDNKNESISTPEMAGRPAPPKVDTANSQLTEASPGQRPPSVPLEGDRTAPISVPAGPLSQPVTSKIHTAQMAPSTGSTTPRPGAGPDGPTLQPNQVHHTAQMSGQPSAHVEFRGAGVLFPALVIGLGEVGQKVLRGLREALFDRFGDLEELPNIRLLYVDSDAEAAAAAVKTGSKGSALSSREVILARLNRPSHYLKPRDGQVDLGTWFDTQMLYRMPRTQATSGLRCLGRLAFVDNYPEIAERIQTDLGAITESEALAAADRHTKLGLRVNRPRVYVVTGLAGGTGSGMYIDIAYTARTYLKALGYTTAEVVGVFFLPPAESTKDKSAAANTFAALTELNHFSMGASFTARYLLKEPPVVHAEPPYNRCIFLGDVDDPKTASALPSMAGAFLLRDLVTGLGRAADARRASFLQRIGQGKPGGPPALQTIGLFRLSWPRKALIHNAARKLCHRLVQAWLSKDTKPFQEPLKTWAKDQWERRGFQPERLISALRAAAEAALDQPPQDLFHDLYEQWFTELQQNPFPEATDVVRMLNQIESIVGRVEGQPPMQEPAVLPEAIEKASKDLLSNYDHKLSQLAIHFVEQPRYRFAGAEEAIRQFNTLLERVIDQQEPLCNDFTNKAQQAHGRIMTILETLKTQPAGSKRRIPIGPELAELFRVYPTVRFQAQVLQRVLSIYRSMLGTCPEYLREFTFCRARLGELLKSMEKSVPSTQVAPELGPGRALFAADCRTLDDAVNQFLKGVTGDEMLEIDQRIQAVLKQQFTALVHVCTTAANLLRDLEGAMQQEMEAFVSGRLGAANVVETFLDQNRREEAAREELNSAFAEASPKLPLERARSVEEVSVALVPAESSQAAEVLRELTQEELTETEVTPGPKGEDIVFYRELVGWTLTQLPHLGPQARESYKQRTAVEHYTPHSRVDINDWRVPSGP